MLPPCLRKISQPLGILALTIPFLGSCVLKAEDESESDVSVESLSPEESARQSDIQASIRIIEEEVHRYGGWSSWKEKWLPFQLDARRIVKAAHST